MRLRDRCVRNRARWSTVCAVLLLMVLSGCAAQSQREEGGGESRQSSVEPTASHPGLAAEDVTVVSYPTEEFDDPLMPINRAVFAFNDVSYRYVMIPVSRVYTGYTPRPVRRGIANVFANIKSPISIVNQLLQGKPRSAGRSTLRFLVNTTVGIGGIFDPAKAWLNLPAETTGFNETLARYGSGYGVYVVLPFLGPADLRSGSGVLADYFLNPIVHLTEQPDTFYIMAADTLQGFSSQAENYATLREESDDPYLFFRNMYLQGLMRDREYRDGSDSGASR